MPWCPGARQRAIAEALRRLGGGRVGPLNAGARALGADEWQSARAAARRAGVDIDARRLHMTGVALITTECRSVRDLIEAGLSRRDLDAVLDHVTLAADDPLRELLRG